MLLESLTVLVPAVISHLKHNTCLFRADLPALGYHPAAPAPQVTPTDTTLIVTAINALRQEHHHAAEVPSTVSDYGSTVNLLLRMAQVTDQVDLPPVYDCIAQTNKKTECLITQDTAYE